MADIPTPDDRRTFQRNSARRVVLLIEGKPFLANDWSPSGFNITYPNSGLQRGDTITGEIDLFEVEEIGTFKATIIRVSDVGQIAAVYDDLSSHSYMNLCMTVSIPEDEFQ